MCARVVNYPSEELHRVHNFSSVFMLLVVVFYLFNCVPQVIIHTNYWQLCIMLKITQDIKFCFVLTEIFRLVRFQARKYINTGIYLLSVGIGFSEVSNAESNTGCSVVRLDSFPGCSLV